MADSDTYSAHGKRLGLKHSLNEFCQNTTFHGLRYVTSGSWFRRLMWLLFVLACLTGVIIQIVDRVQHFRSWPLNVNVKINYNQTLKFPAVTVCNQNAFRATRAARYGYYELLEEMFSGHQFNASHLEIHGASNVSLETLYTNLAHDKHDLIVKCEWNKLECTADDFDLLLTDHGVCFIFKQREEDLLVSASGVDAGLRMTFNVEQYEYMTGPHSAAGVKILLHDPREMPFVHELGQAIPTGSHAFVGVKFTAIENLPLPYGECAYKKLPHTDFYTSEECYSDCLVTMAAKTCGCRDTYMPAANGEPPVCTLHEYYTCLEELKVTFETTLREQCTCPVPCAFSIFDPSISYATISNHVVDQLLSNSRTGDLEQDLLRATEVTAKYDEKKFTSFQKLVNELFSKFNIIKTVIQQISDSLELQRNKTEAVNAEIWSVYQEKERLFRFQEYAVEKNFLRGREAMEERTLRNVPDAYAEYALTLKRRIERLADLETEKETEREILYDLIIDALRVRLEVIRMARANITLLIDSFINGTRIFNYMFEDTPRSHNDAITPKPLMNYSMNHNWYMQRYVPKLKTSDFDLFEYVFEKFENVTNIAYENRTVNASELNWVYERFQFACRTFMFSKSVVYSQGIELPLAVLQDRHQDFDNIWNSFNSQITIKNQSFLSLSDKIGHINTEIIPALEGVMLQLQRYITNESESLETLAETFIANSTLQYERGIEDFFQDVQTRGQTIQDSWSLMTDPVHDLWDKIINDEDAIEYYQFTNNTKFLQNITAIMTEWGETVSGIHQADIRTPVKYADIEFSEAFNDVFTHLEEFRKSIKIDGNFLKQNFLKLDVFFRQLSYEQIHQQKAYDFFALICDIGGAMGLFIGASMLTVVEVLDLLLTQTPLFARKEKEKLGPIPPAKMVHVLPK